MSKPRLTPWRKDDSGDSLDYFRFIEGDEERNHEVVHVCEDAWDPTRHPPGMWWIYKAPESGACFDEEEWDPDTESIDEVCERVSRIASQWYECPELAQSSGHGRVQTPVATDNDAPTWNHANCSYAGYCVIYHDLGVAPKPCAAG